MATFTVPQVADYLSDGYWDDTGSRDHKYFVTEGDTITFNVTGLTAEGQVLARAAFESWSEVTGIIFQEVNTGGTITFTDHEGDPVGDAFGGSAYDPSTGESVFGEIHIAESWIDYYGTDFDTYSFQTYIHEIGHVLGLGHASNYDGSATFGVDNDYDNDSWQMTVMSYFDQVENTFTTGFDSMAGSKTGLHGDGTAGDATYSYVVTAQIADIVAMQNMYGVASTRAGDTIYFGPNSDAGGIWDLIDGFSNSVAFTVLDSGGFDTLDFSASSANQKINLQGGTISDVFGGVGNMVIFTDTVIEKAIGGSGNDVIRGNTADNELWGNAGDDVLVGGLGKDKLYGGADNDLLRGDRGNDTLDGGTGNDILRGGLGNDTMTGGTGADWFIFRADDDFSNASGIDTITDFEAGIDTIKLKGYQSSDVVLTDDMSDGVGGAYDLVVNGTHTVHIMVQGGGTITLVDDFVFEL